MRKAKKIIETRSKASKFPIASEVLFLRILQKIVFSLFFHSGEEAERESESSGLEGSFENKKGYIHYEGSIENLTEYINKVLNKKVLKGSEPEIADEQYDGSKDHVYGDTVLELVKAQKFKEGYKVEKMKEAMRVCLPAVGHQQMIDNRTVSRLNGDKEEERESHCFLKNMHVSTAAAERCIKRGHLE